MEVTNYLDLLPVELHLYIADIIESDRKWHEEKQRIRKHIEDNFIRHHSIGDIHTNNQGILYHVNNGNSIYYGRYRHILINKIVREGMTAHDITKTIFYY